MHATPASLQAAKPNIGACDDEAAALQEVVDKLVRALSPRAIYLFGSRAEGRARPDSDFDLLVVFDDSAPDAAITYEAAYAPVCGFGVGCDIVPCRAAELDEVLQDPTNPWHETWRRARKLNERC